MKEVGRVLGAMRGKYWSQETRNGVGRVLGAMRGKYWSQVTRNEVGNVLEVRRQGMRWGGYWER